MLSIGSYLVSERGVLLSHPLGSTPLSDMFTYRGLAYLHKGRVIVYGTSYKSYAIFPKYIPPSHGIFYSPQAHHITSHGLNPIILAPFSSPHKTS